MADTNVVYAFMTWLGALVGCHVQPLCHMRKWIEHHVTPTGTCYGRRGTMDVTESTA